jgi:glycerol uptake facilitator protein
MDIFNAELIGTALLVTLGDGVVANVVLSKSKAQNAGWIVVATGWGLAVALAAYCVGTFSGAHLNPAVTVGLAVIGKLDWGHVPTYLVG